VWATLEHARAARFPGARGRIPNFSGSETAAGRLAGRREWQIAGVVKANPDSPQLPVRRRALADGKLVYMAVPRLSEERPFVRLESEATIKGAMREGRLVALEDMERVDLVVCGSVAVNPAGVRVGKGGGYSDLELGLLVEAGVVDDETVTVTTVHGLQLLDEELPETEHDFRVDLVVTPEEVVETGACKRPPGILWHHLDEQKIATVPLLARLRPRA
jgi:5-formyltetrahydrofolate cyclo-ligase